jgi:hypothetical protein
MLSKDTKETVKDASFKKIVVKKLKEAGKTEDAIRMELFFQKFQENKDTKKAQ